MKLKSKCLLNGKIRVTKRNIETKEITYQTEWESNLIVDVGITAILRRLGNQGTKTNEGVITYGALGNGAAAVDPGDTTMQNELIRKPIAVYAVAGDELELQVFFTNSEGNDTITRFALFGEDATATVDTGTMFDHIAFSSSFTKTSAEDLTVEIIISAEGA